MTTYIDARYVSAELKRQLTAAFPGAKFSVRRGKGTGSASIDVTWTDGPSDTDVAAIARPMQGSSWNGYDERYESTGNEVTVTIDGKRVTGKPVVDHMSLHQEVSDEARAEALALWKAANGEDTDTQATNGGFTCEGEFIGGSWGVNQVLDIARKVVLPRRWKAAQEAAAVAAPEPAAPAEPAPAALFGPGIDATHTEEEGIVVRGTRRGDGSAPVLRDQGLKWHRKEGYWYLPGTRGAAGAERLDAVRDALRAAGLFPAPTGVLEAAPAADPAEEAPAVEEVASDAPAEEPGNGLEAGAHRITNTGEGIDGPGSAYAFRCLVCDKRARLVEFGDFPCTDEAEDAYLLEVAARLLDDVGLRGADVFHVIGGPEDTAPLQSRAEATRFLAAQLQFGATHHWYEGELRLARGGRTAAYIKPAPAPQPCDQRAPETYRGVPVPAHVAGAWGEQGAGAAWREGVDAALTFAVLARAAN
ncbi:LPD29 domain-containing protein [Streptomyces sp. NPDC048352]|uniref:LPD29 domain-containing protein n=1 Tax=Streptomyces sp. NPDC048352 TaxID=3154718 RepID=UPI003438DE57